MKVEATQITNYAVDGYASTQSFSVSGLVPGRIMLFSIATYVSSGTPNIPSVSLSGWSFIQITSQLYSTRRRHTVFLGIGTTTGGTILVDSGQGTTQQWLWSITQFKNTANSIAAIGNVANSIGSGTSCTVTLGSFSSPANATFGVITKDASGYSIGSGYTALGQSYQDASGYPGSQTIGAEWKNTNDNSVDWSLPGGGDAYCGIGIEIKFKKKGGGFIGNL